MYYTHPYVYVASSQSKYKLLLLSPFRPLVVPIFFNSIQFRLPCQQGYNRCAP
jgi:hypothetical protein